MHANEPVSPDRLIDALWGERPAATARTALQGYITQLRRLLEPSRKKRAAGEVLVTTPAGYVLRVAKARSTVTASRRSQRRATRRSPSSRPAQAAELLRSALELWRGPALAEFADEAWARTREPSASRNSAWSALEERIEAELELGHHAELVAELEALVAEHPLRERPRALLMRALYGPGGRQKRSSATSRRDASWWMSWVSIRAPSCASCKQRSCVRTRSSRLPLRRQAADQPTCTDDTARRQGARARGGGRAAGAG